MLITIEDLYRINVKTPQNYHLSLFRFQGAVSATYHAIRNQSPLVPAMGNITMSDLARRRKKSRVKEDTPGSGGSGNNPGGESSPSTPV